MATFTELLPPSKSHPHRAMTYTPACAGVGVLVLTDSRSHTRYAVAVQPFGGVRLTKQGGDESYVVTPAACECKGWTFGRGVRCKHIEAVETLLGCGWLDAFDADERETVADLHAEAEEKDAWYARGTLAHEPLPC